MKKKKAILPLEDKIFVVNDYTIHRKMAHIEERRKIQYNLTGEGHIFPQHYFDLGKCYRNFVGLSEDLILYHIIKNNVNKITVGSWKELDVLQIGQIYKMVLENFHGCTLNERIIEKRLIREFGRLIFVVVYSDNFFARLE